MKRTSCLWFGCRYILQPFLLLLGITYSGYSQKVQYASKVIKYSSDLGGKVNSINRILGKPDAFPQGGFNANSWAPKDSNLPGFVVLEFAETQSVKQIAVFENLNAGTVNKVMLAGVDGKFKTVDKKTSDFVLWTQKVQRSGDPGRAYYFNRKRRKVEQAEVVNQNPDITYIHLDQAEAEIKQIRIEFNFPSIPGQKQIDAVAISDSDQLILPLIDTITYTNSSLKAQTIWSASDPETIIGALKLVDSNLYFTELKENSSGKILKLNLVSTLVNHELSLAQSSSLLGYSNIGDYSDGYLNFNGTKLIIGAESDISYGGFDLYISHKKPDGTFSLLENLGRYLNTAGDEINPFLLQNEKTILFSANSSSGYGDFDLYVSNRLDDTWKKWSPPKNLGSIINSKNFDLYPAYDEKNEILYYITMEENRQVIKKVSLALVDLSNIN